MNPINELELLQPDDWHLHVRDGALLPLVVGHSAREFARAIIMPNLTPPVTTVAAAEDYAARIRASLPKDNPFRPLMTLYLTDATTPEELTRAKQSKEVVAVKYYPAGATTNSQAGVTDFTRAYPLFEHLAEIDLPLLVHGEVTDPSVDVFDREKVFIERHLATLIARLPSLRVVLEHVTTQEGVEFVRDSPSNVAATITAHHMLMHRNQMFEGGFRPHHYCLPVLKRAQHQTALIAAATSGNPKFFLGTDSAPHTRGAKESACGCAGIYTAHAALSFYAEAFEQANALNRLEGFASFFGADFYRLPRNTQRIRLIKSPWDVPESYPWESDTLIPFRAGLTLQWRLGG